MAFSNAERQRRYRQRIKRAARTPTLDRVCEAYEEARTALLTDWLKAVDGTDRAVLGQVLKQPTDRAAILEAFDAWVRSRVMAEYRKLLR